MIQITIHGQGDKGLEIQNWRWYNAASIYMDPVNKDPLYFSEYNFLIIERKFATK